MTQKIKQVAMIVVIIIIAFCVGRYVFPHLAKGFGGVTNYDELDATAMKIGGSSGSRLGPIVEGSCALLANAATAVSASTTAVADCAVTGVVSGDNVLAEFSTSTVSSPTWGATSAQWIVISAKASTTAGFITVVALNYTGGTASLSASGIASSTIYRISHPITSVPGL